MQNDVANKAIEANPLNVGGMTFSVIPTGALASYERPTIETPVSPSGLNQKYADNFDDIGYYV